MKAVYLTFLVTRSDCSSNDSASSSYPASPPPPTALTSTLKRSTRSLTTSMFGSARLHTETSRGSICPPRRSILAYVFLDVDDSVMACVATKCETDACDGLRCKNQLDLGSLTLFCQTSRISQKLQNLAVL